MKKSCLFVHCKITKGVSMQCKVFSGILNIASWTAKPFENTVEIFCWFSFF
jgi:hypothetical protein